MSDWICHVKAFAKEHSLKYGEALRNPKCSGSYTKKTTKTVAKSTKPVKSEAKRLIDLASLVKKL
jgi:hypothetical protein